MRIDMCADMCIDMWHCLCTHPYACLYTCLHTAQLADSLLSRGSDDGENDAVCALHVHDTKARLARFAGALVYMSVQIRTACGCTGIHTHMSTHMSIQVCLYTHVYTHMPTHTGMPPNPSAATVVPIELQRAGKDVLEFTRRPPLHLLRIVQRHAHGLLGRAPPRGEFTEM